MVSFAWPPLLGLLASVPLLVVGYRSLDRRRTAQLAAVAALGFLPSPATIRMHRKRHLPVVLFGIALSLMLVAVARPRIRVVAIQHVGTAVLVFDMSNSMRATDVKPTRFVAAQLAARAFVERQPARLRIGVVAFNGGSVMLQRPTTERFDVLAAIDRLKPNGSTSLGQGIFAALTAIAGAPLNVGSRGQGGPGATIPYLGAAMIVFSDGENTAAPDPIEVAKLASVAGVRIYTVGIGFPSTTVVDVDGFRIATTLDEVQLTEIAKVTNGAYVRVDAASASATLANIYRAISLHANAGTRLQEITPLVSGIGLGFLCMGSVLAMLWFGRMV